MQNPDPKAGEGPRVSSTPSVQIHRGPKQQTLKRLASDRKTTHETTRK